MGDLGGDSGWESGGSKGARKKKSCRYASQALKLGPGESLNEEAREEKGGSVMNNLTKKNMWMTGEEKRIDPKWPADAPTRTWEKT